MFFVKQNKEFIYRGNEYEKLETFQCRLLSEFTDASILNTNSPPDDNIRQANDKCILASNVVQFQWNTSLLLQSFNW